MSQEQLRTPVSRTERRIWSDVGGGRVRIVEGGKRRR